MIINYKENIKKITLVRQGKIKEGLRLDIPEIDEYFRFKFSNFNVFLGHSNTGKTTLVLYMMLMYAVKHNIKWLVFSSENESYSLIKKLIEFLEGTIINKVQDSHFESRTKWINEHFQFIDANNLYCYKNLLDFAVKMKKDWDYQGFLIDPYNSLLKNQDLNKSMNSHEYDYYACSEMRVFCKKHQISIWLNTHASTDSLRKKHPDRHEYAGHPAPPFASDVEGGGKFVNRADDFIVIHRYIQHPSEWMNTLIHIRKIKDVDTGGRPTPIDRPIKIRSVKNNVGFQLNGKNLLDLPKRVQTDLPF
jgi:hypothetical protein